MLAYVRENIQFTFLLLLWIVSGALLGSLTIAIVGGTLLLLAVRGYYAEILIGFWFILMFSDSRLDMFQFAADGKKFIIVILLLIFFLQRNVIIKGKNEIFSLFLPFFIWSLLILYDNPRVGLAFQKTLSYGLLFLMVPIFTRYVLETNQRAFIRSAIYFMVIYLVLGIAMRYVSFDTVYQDGRFRGFMGNPNGLGLLVFLFAIFFDTCIRKDQYAIPRWQRIGIWLVILANLIYCQSRSALLATALYVLFSNIRLFRGYVGVLAFASILLSYGYLLQNAESVILSLGLESVFRIENLEGGSGRTIAWEFAWANLQDNFFVGKGFTWLDWVFWQNYDLLTTAGHLGNAHNSWLTFWFDTGLVGLIMYVVAFFLLFFRIAKVYDNAIPVMYAVIFSSSFESWLTASLNPMTITLIMTLTIMLHGRQIESEDELLLLEEDSVEIEPTHA